MVLQLKNKVQRPLEMLEKTANPQTVYEFTEEMPDPEVRNRRRHVHPSSLYIIF